MVKKLSEYIRLDRIPACDEQTDRQTSWHGIVRARRSAYASRGKNDYICFISQVSITLPQCCEFRFLSLQNQNSVCVTFGIELV